MTMLMRSNISLHFLIKALGEFNTSCIEFYQWMTTLDLEVESNLIGFVISS